jgi:hypothetical protein
MRGYMDGKPIILASCFGTRGGMAASLAQQTKANVTAAAGLVHYQRTKTGMVELTVTPGSSGKGKRDVFQTIGPDGKVNAEYSKITYNPNNGEISFTRSGAEKVNTENCAGSGGKCKK